MASHGRDERRRERQRPARGDRDEPTSSRGGGPTLNEFFVNGKGIHREVLQREICKYLGPEAYSRPSVYNGNPGFTITAVRPFTPKMLDDLQELSRSYVQENREAVDRGYKDIPYEQSRTHQQAQVEEMYDQRGYQTPSSYPVPGAQPGYPSSTRAQYAPPPGAYADPPYPGALGYGQAPGYSTEPGYGRGARPGPTDIYTPPYTDRGDESPRTQYIGGRPQDLRTVDPRRDPRDPRDVRDPRDPRDPRHPRPDPRYDPRPDPRMDSRTAYPVADSRMHPNDLGMDPRGMPNYSYPGNSPADILPRGYDDYVNTGPQLGRGAGYQPAPRVQTGYDTRESPNMRDTYRHEPIREERRRRN